MPQPLDFAIVGTPRSGTTLVQRLACELEGVSVPPETHFLRTFAPGLLSRRRFPLEGAALLAELRAFAALDTSRGLDLQPEAVAARLGGRADTLLDLFGAVVRSLAGDADVYGEKTPSHLRWWRELCAAIPELRLVVVVRDPRAVVASYFDAWGPRPHAVIAERWAIDQGEVEAARAELGPARCLVLRYEDVVRDPGVAQRRLSALLGVPPRARPTGNDAPLFLPWETWKQQAAQPVTTARAERWHEVLSPAVAREVAAIAGRRMPAFGYDGVTERRRPGPRAQWLRYRYRWERSIERVRRAELTGIGGFT